MPDGLRSVISTSFVPPTNSLYITSLLKSNDQDCNAAAKPNIAKLEVLPFLNISGVA